MMEKHLMNNYMELINKNYWIVCLSAFLLYSCDSKVSHQIQVEENTNLKTLVSSTLKKEIENQSVIVDLSSLFHAEYDSLFILSPYTLLNEIEKKRGIDLHDLAWVYQQKVLRKELAQVTEKNCLFLFMKNSSITDYFLFPRSEVDFSSSANLFRSTNNLVFKIDKSQQTNGKLWINARAVTSINTVSSEG